MERVVSTPAITTERKDIPERLSGLSSGIDEGYLNLDLLYELNGEKKPFPWTWKIQKQKSTCKNSRVQGQKDNFPEPQAHPGTETKNVKKSQKNAMNSENCLEKR